MISGIDRCSSFAYCILTDALVRTVTSELLTSFIRSEMKKRKLETDHSPSDCMEMYADRMQFYVQIRSMAFRCGVEAGAISVLQR